VLLFISKIAETTSAAINCGSFPFCKMLRPIQMKTNNKICYEGQLEYIN
jgi:hypothetical protein